MKVAVACGGTGGHVYPGLATAMELRRRGHEVTLWLTGRATEEAARREWAGSVVEVASRGFGSKAPWDAARTLCALGGAVVRCRREMKRTRPEALLAMGSYASAGPCAAARWCGVPLVLHEANVVPGRAVKFFARGAAAVAAGFGEARKYLRTARVEETGIPLRAELVAAASRLPPRDAIGVAGAPLRLLVVGGSMGAHRLNEVVSAAVVALAQRGIRVRVTHLTGRADEAMVRTAYATAGGEAEVLAFTGDMARLYAATDLAICRAGASTCAELALFGVPALLVPYPHAALDHQTANARALEKRGAADVVEEASLRADWLEAYLAETVRNPARLARLREASHRAGLRDGTSALADLVERVARPFP